MPARRPHHGTVIAAIACALTITAGACTDDATSHDEASTSAPPSSAVVRPDCAPGGTTLADAPPGPSPLPALPDEGASLAALIARSFCAPSWTYNVPDGSQRTSRATVVLAPAEASCIGSSLVEQIGVERLDALPFGHSVWSAIGFGLTANALPEPLTRAESETLVDAFRGCTAEWEELLIRSVTEGAERISDASATCASAALDDTAGREVFVTELDRAYDDPTQPDAARYPDNIAPLIAAFDACLTVDEYAGLDFN